MGVGRYFGRQPRYSQQEAEAQAKEAIDAAVNNGRPPEEDWKALGSRMGDISRELALRPPVDIPPPPPPRRAQTPGNARRPRVISEILRPPATTAPDPAPRRQGRPAAAAPVDAAPAKRTTPATPPAKRTAQAAAARPAPAKRATRGAAPAKKATGAAAASPAPAKRAARASATPTTRPARALEPEAPPAATRPAAKKRSG